ncbi:MAG TPA: hypothetical protein VIK55_06535 [Paludibacter sp.]
MENKNKSNICKWKEETCTEERVRYPGKSILSPFCLYHLRCHQAISHVYKKRIEIAKDKAELEKARISKKNTPQEKFYQLTAWKNCSKAVLLHYADEDLMVQCCTSGRFYKVNDSDLHCGHYHKSDRHKSTAFEFKNLAPQSASDNTKKGGLPEVMAEWIERTHGVGTLEWLNIEKNKTLHLDKITLEHISKFYLNMLNEELKRRNIKNPWK